MRTYRLVLALAILDTTSVWPWALKKELEQQRPRQLCLTSKALKNHRLRYSLRQSRPDPQTRVEIQAALGLWLEHFPPTSIESVEPGQPCDLSVEFGATPAGDTSQGAFTAVGEDCMIVRINTDHVWHERRGIPGNANGDYFWQPFKALAGPGESLPSLIAASRSQTLDQFASQRGFSHSTVFWTTYHTFIHEFGHAFGLADTNQLMESQSPPAWRSAGPQPNSVMQTSNFFYLTPDDLAGLRCLQTL